MSTIQPFKRSKIMSQAIAAIMSFVPNANTYFSAQEAIAALGQYRSRGKKGRGREVARARHGKHMDAVRLSKKAKNINKRKSQ